MLHEQSSKLSRPAWQPSDNEDYVLLQGFVLLPYCMMPAITEHGVRIDYDYVKDGKGRSTKEWKFHENPRINIEMWSWKRLNAMRVLGKLEGKL